MNSLMQSKFTGFLDKNNKKILVGNLTYCHCYSKGSALGVIKEIAEDLFIWKPANNKMVRLEESFTKFLQVIER